MNALVFVGCLAGALSSDRPCLASPESAAASKEKLDSTHQLVGRFNPLGLFYSGRLSYRIPLYTSPDPVAKNNFLGFGLVPSVSARFARVGALAEVQPLSIFRLWASYEVVGYFGSFDAFQSFPGVFSEHDDTSLSNAAGGDPLEESYSTMGTQLNLGTLVELRPEPVVLRSSARLAYASYDLRDGDRTFYDPLFDVLVPNEGWFMVHDLDIRWVTEFGLEAGATWTITHAFYEDRHYAQGEEISRNPNTPHQRIGPVFAYRLWDAAERSPGDAQRGAAERSRVGAIHSGPGPGDHGRSAFDRPKITVSVSWWIEHRYRTGADVDQSIPQVILSFSFTGDLLSVGR